MKLLRVLVVTVLFVVLTTACINAGEELASPEQNASQLQETGAVNEAPEQLKWLEGSVMDGALSFYRNLYVGLSGEDVRNLQQRLFDLGYLEFSPDGIFDARTDAALRAFQEEHGLYVDGIMGRQTLAALNWRHFLDEPVTSELADSKILTEKCYSREGQEIRFLIPHHMAARNTGADCAAYFTYNTAGTSANYCIGYGGDIAQNVPEQYGAWTSGDVNFDRQAITMEISDTAGNDYRIPQAAQDAFVELCVDLVKRYPSLGGRLLYDPEDEARVIAAKNGTGSWDAIKGNVLIHCWTTTVGTTCPEWHLKAILPELVERVNQRLAEEEAQEKAAALSEYWAEDSPAAQSLREFVEKVTDPDDPDNYIPVKDRIAVFDMDGTLTCETYYTYYDTMMFIEYCLHDHPERVSDELKEVASSIKPGYTADEALARNFARAYAGMTVEEFYDYAVEFGQKYTSSFENMRYNEGSYLPMVELVKYLYENDFTIYVISGTERTTTRAVVANSPLNEYVSPSHVIGTIFEVKVKGYETESSNMNFKYEDGDELVLTGGFIQKDLNANKAILIQREIGQRPVLAFGNSGSDSSMLNYTIDSRNPYPAQAYMVVADDDVREWGTQDWETKSADYIAKGYIPISMRTEFAQIYPEGITKAPEQYNPAEWAPESETEEETLAEAA